MTSFGLPALFVLFLWWFSTGAVIYLNNLPRSTYRWSIAGATAVLAASLYGLFVTSHSDSVTSAYLSFTFGLLVWAWTQLTFYTGLITGPRKTACPSSCGGPRHFWHAVETCQYHELTAAGLGVAVCFATMTGENHVGAWTYTIIWLMHLSAKTNAVLGVRNLNEHFFPEHLRYLGSFLKQRSMNLLFPVSITVPTVIIALLVQRAYSDQVTAFEHLSLIFYIVILALGLLEHWFLVLPIPAEALWNWSVKARTALAGSEPEPKEAEPAEATPISPRPRLRVVGGQEI